MGTQDYFSLDDILATEPRVYATFRVRGHALAHLDPLGVAVALAHAGKDVDAAEDVEHLPEGHRVALPFWLVEALAERAVVDVELPRCFATTVRAELRADARVVALHRKCPAYFALGIALAKLLRDPGLPDMLLRAYADRCWGVVDAAVYGGGKGIDGIRKLELRERDLFFAAHGMSVAVRRWKERRSDKITRADIAVCGKRKREDTQGVPQSRAVSTSPVTPRQRVR